MAKPPLGYSLYGDSVYNLSFTFPHADDAVTFEFSGQGLQDVWDESWGLDNVMVSLNPMAAETSLQVVSRLATEAAWRVTNSVPVTAVRVSGSLALVQLGDSEVRLLSMTNPAAPVALGSWRTFLPLSDAVLVGNLAYIASNGKWIT